MFRAGKVSRQGGLKMREFESLSKDRLIQLADELVKSIKDATWLNDRTPPRPKLAEPTPHMYKAIEDYEYYKFDPCPTCRKSRREL